MSAQAAIVGSVQIPISAELVDGILSAAFEGGITYWASKVEVGDFLGLDYASEVISKGGSVRIVEQEDLVDLSAGPYEGHVLDLPKLLKGIELALDNPNVDLADMDATGADVIVQFALFGEIVYG